MAYISTITRCTQVLMVLLASFTGMIGSNQNKNTDCIQLHCAFKKASGVWFHPPIIKLTYLSYTILRQQKLNKKGTFSFHEQQQNGKEATPHEVILHHKKMWQHAMQVVQARNNNACIMCDLLLRSTLKHSRLFHLTSREHRFMSLYCRTHCVNFELQPEQRWHNL